MKVYSLWGSNPRPMAHKTIALTTELRERPMCMAVRPADVARWSFANVRLIEFAAGSKVLQFLKCEIAHANFQNEARRREEDGGE